ncbi:MAG: multiple antibiotic resistance protein [Candidatus Sumerlaeota bacterium]|nr:multiple antibiotic resistance protein [Candidatus Sumerlaeota bacterium]
MEFEINYYLKSFVSLFAISDPIGTVPLFLLLTAGMTKHDLRRTMLVMIGVSAGILLASVWGGRALLEFFNIGIPAFRAAGGILLLLVAMDMLQARSTRTKRTPEETEEAVDRDDIAVMPLAVPMLAGPGAVSTTIVYSNQGETLLHTILLSVVILSIAGTSGMIFWLAQPIGRLLGKSGLNLVSRLMGLILAAVGVEFIFHGVAGFFPVLGGS